MVDAAPVPIDDTPVRVLSVVKAYMPVIEEITGLKRRDLFLPLLKMVGRGRFDGLLDTLAGNPPPMAAPEPRYFALGKFLAIWIPVGVFALGLALLGLFFLARFLAGLL